MSFISRRSIAAIAIATVATFPIVASTAEARTTQADRPAHSQSKHVKKFHAKFVLSGRVTAVSENSITVTVKGGNLKKRVRGTDLVLGVTATTKITVEDVQKALADVLVGDRVNVKGTRTRTDGVITYAANRVHVKHSKTKSESAPASTPTATPVTS